MRGTCRTSWRWALPSDLTEHFARIGLVAFDVDGTLTDGRVIVDGNGVDAVSFAVVLDQEDQRRTKTVDNGKYKNDDQNFHYHDGSCRIFGRTLIIARCPSDLRSN